MKNKNKATINTAIKAPIITPSFLEYAAGLSNPFLSIAFNAG
jgi:hypothetical protein